MTKREMLRNGKESRCSSTSMFDGSRISVVTKFQRLKSNRYCLPKHFRHKGDSDVREGRTVTIVVEHAVRFPLTLLRGRSTLIKIAHGSIFSHILCVLTTVSVTKLLRYRLSNAYSYIPGALETSTMV